MKKDYVDPGEMHGMMGEIRQAISNLVANAIDAMSFRWSWMWERIASWFDLNPAPFSGGRTPLEEQLAASAPVWSAIARKHELLEPDLNVLISPWHTDADLGRPIEVITDMSKSRKLGFLDYQATDDSFFDLFARLRNVRLIP